MTIAELITRLHSQPGVVSARFDEQSQTVDLRYDGTQVSVARLESLIQQAAPAVQLRATPARVTTPEEEELASLPWMARLTALCLLLIALTWALEELAGLPPAIAWALYAGAYLSGGFYSVQGAWASLREREFDVNVLMVVAALGAALVGQPREGAILMFLFSLSNTLETYAMGRTHASIRALLDMTPKEAEVYRGGGLARVPVEDVRVGELVLVRPGAQIPADGVVARGESAVNEAPITGEALPVEKAQGSRVYAGTLNGQGALDVRVATPVESSTLARIVEVVREARQQKARSQDFTDRVVGRYYAYAVVGIALLAILIPLLFLGWELKATLYRAMTLMVVASPCALVISIPAALLSALASAARGGVLFKGGRHLESAARVQVVAFDKTGTLTTGRPGVVTLLVLGGEAELSEIAGAEQGVRTPSPQAATSPAGPLSAQQLQLLDAAAAIESDSEHPLARAIVRAAEEQGLRPEPAEAFEAMAGAGAQATLSGRRLQIGRPSLWPGLPDETVALVRAQEEQGYSVVLLGTAEAPWGLIGISDTVRPEAAAAVAELKRSGVRRVVLLTGDNEHAATTIGAGLGVDEIHAGLLPQQKVELIRTLQERYGPVAMVGDGINDAPALASAALGVAMGAGGSDVALESADVLLIGDDLSRLARSLRLARAARRVVLQNLTFAFGVMATLMLLALVGDIALSLGVIGHEGSTLVVVANGLRLLAYRD